MIGQWGPFLSGIDPAERLARLRSLRVATHILCGSRGRHLEAALRQAERDDAALLTAETAFDQLAALDRRRVLATYGATL